MVNVSTLVYVLEHLEGEKSELVDLNEISNLEQSVLNELSGILNQVEFEAKPQLVKEVLQRSSIV